MRVHDLLVGERGQALLGTLLLLFTVTGSAAIFVWFMNQQQTRAGDRYRATAARHAAEAGVYWTLSVLESQAPNGSGLGRHWRTNAYSDRVQLGSLEGRFTLSIEEEPGGSLLINSLGQVGNRSQRLKARAHLTSPALAAAIFGKGIVKIDGRPVTTTAAQLETKDHPWVHVMAGREVWFASSGISVNNFTLHLSRAGPTGSTVESLDSRRRLDASLVRILLYDHGIVTLGAEHRPVTETELRILGIPIASIVRRNDAAPEVDFDRSHFQAQATTNTGNSAINRVAGKYYGDVQLEGKQHSLYSGEEFARLLAYLAGIHSPPALRGTIYVAGSVTIPQSMTLSINNGTLVAESTVHLSPSTGVSIMRSTGHRSEPALIVLDHGGLAVSEQARFLAHGLVFVNRTVFVGQGASIDISGSLCINDPGVSLLVTGGSLVIRYDPSVRGTAGIVLSDRDPVLAWISSWTELP